LHRSIARHALRTTFAFVGILGIACGGDTPTTPTTPVATTTDVFTGSLNLGETKIHAFTVTASGTAELTLASLTVAGQVIPQPVTIGIGTPSEATCSLSTSISIRPALTYQVGYAVTAGSFCVSIADAGNVLVNSATYSLRLVHP
jgi:hypothetical protein